MISPAAEHLFKINIIGKLLSEDWAILINRLVTKLMFVIKRARPDIQTTIAFLITRVKNPDEDDWKSLQLLLQYLYGTR